MQSIMFIGIPISFALTILFPFCCLPWIFNAKAIDTGHGPKTNPPGFQPLHLKYTLNRSQQFIPLLSFKHARMTLGAFIFAYVFTFHAIDEFAASEYPLAAFAALAVWLAGSTCLRGIRMILKPLFKPERVMEVDINAYEAVVSEDGQNQQVRLGEGYVQLHQNRIWAIYFSRGSTVLIPTQVISNDQMRQLESLIDERTLWREYPRSHTDSQKTL